MTISTDRELARVRLRFLDLIKSFFISEPDAERMSRWRGIISALRSDVVNPDFDRVTGQLSDLLRDSTLQAIRDEYYCLFTDPFSDNQVSTQLSYYRDGRSYGPGLADYRGFLRQAGIGKDPSVTEPEDSLVLMLDALATLIEEEMRNARQTRSLQTILLNRFLIPTCAGFTQALCTRGGAEFYAACGEFLRCYLMLEQGLMNETETVTV